MTGSSPIDTSYDMRTDARGKDPDGHSPTLRSYHRQLWGKPLPSGAPFELDAKLRHTSGLGFFWLSSDAIAHTYMHWKRSPQLTGVIRRIPADETDAFYGLSCTIGAYIVFPFQIQVDGKWRQSINQQRGMNAKIRDRFDLTLECIRRHYASEPSPLGETLANYASFFALFGNFRGYVDHFLLNDLVSGDYTSVRFYKAFDHFRNDALPAASVDEYREYMTRSMDFVRARNARIADFSASLR
jgi:hypothetical protein